MNLQDFQPQRRLESRAQARAALDETLSELGQHLRWFDDDGSFYGLERPEVSAALTELLKSSNQTRVTIVLHDVTHLQRKGARMLNLLRAFAPRIQIFRTDESIRSFAKGLLLADDSVLLRRPQFGQSVTYVDYDEKAIASAAALFEDILGNTSVAVASQTTGL